MYAGSPWHADDVTEYDYDPEAAKELLAEAGYPDGFTTTFVCPTSGSGNMFPQIMNEYIKRCAEEVGINIELDMSESERVWDVMKVGFKDEYADVGALNTSFYTMFPNVFQSSPAPAAPSTPATTATRSMTPASRTPTPPLIWTSPPSGSSSGEDLYGRAALGHRLQRPEPACRGAQRPESDPVSDLVCGPDGGHCGISGKRSFSVVSCMLSDSGN